MAGIRNKHHVSVNVPKNGNADKSKKKKKNEKIEEVKRNAAQKKSQRTGVTGFEAAVRFPTADSAVPLYLYY